MSPRASGVLQVAFALIERRGRLLICQRKAGSHLAGYWEFPGGKRKPAESWTSCLRRELQEELGVTVRNLRPYTRLAYRYPERRMTFKVFRCEIASGHPKALEVKALRWVTPRGLSRYRFPPADRDLIRRLSADCRD